MTDSTAIRNLIRERGLKYGYIANAMGISRFTLQQKIDNQREFKTSEITALCEIVGVVSLADKEKLFFVHDVD